MKDKTIVAVAGIGLILGLVLLRSKSADAQLLAGCTDKNALNYDSTAEIDDGSCVYGGVPPEECLAETMMWDPVQEKCVIDPRWACTEGKVWSEKSNSCVCPSGTFWHVWPCLVAPCPGECLEMDEYVLN